MAARGNRAKSDESNQTCEFESDLSCCKKAVRIRIDGVRPPEMLTAANQKTFFTLTSNSQYSGDKGRAQSRCHYCYCSYCFLDYNNNNNIIIILFFIIYLL